MARLVIREERPARWLPAALVVLVLVAGGAGAYLWRDRLAGALRGGDAAAVERERDSAERTRLAAASEALRRRVSSLERTLQVERSAAAQVTSHLEDLQARILELEEEVAFYRGIVDANDRRGVNVQTLVIEPGERPGQYRFELVLTRNMKSDTLLQGRAALAISGEQDGRPRTLSNADLLGGGASGIDFRFQYFQRLEGRLSLPPDFVPRRVRVQIEVPGSRQARTERAFDWHVAAG